METAAGEVSGLFMQDLFCVCGVADAGACPPRPSRSICRGGEFARVKIGANNIKIPANSSFSDNRLFPSRRPRRSERPSRGSSWLFRRPIARC
jgi:hypothetical protein